MNLRIKKDLMLKAMELIKINQTGTGKHYSREYSNLLKIDYTEKTLKITSINCGLDFPTVLSIETPVISETCENLFLNDWNLFYDSINLFKNKRNEDRDLFFTLEKEGTYRELQITGEFSSRKSTLTGSEGNSTFLEMEDKLNITKKGRHSKHELNIEVFKKAFEKISCCIADKIEVRKVLTGAGLHIKKNYTENYEVVLLGADGKSLGLESFNISPVGNFETVYKNIEKDKVITEEFKGTLEEVFLSIPGESVKKLIKLFPKSGEFILKTAHFPTIPQLPGIQVEFSVGDLKVTFTSKIPEGKYVNYKQVIPLHKDYEVKVDREDLMTILKDHLNLCNKINKKIGNEDLPLTKMHVIYPEETEKTTLFQNGKLLFKSGNSNWSTLDDSLIVQFKTHCERPFSPYSVNPEYFLNCIKHHNDVLNIQLSGDLNPIVIVSLPETNYKTLFMPVRIKE